MRYIGQVLGVPGDWRMARTVANGQPVVAAYLRGDDGTHRAFGMAVLSITSTGIARIMVFDDPELLVTFGLIKVHNGLPRGAINDGG
jgi:RNA polymerase sigma-70 factor (ECF subfamily)